MGVLVGGIYATGRSPAAIKEITDGINWDDVLRGETPFKDLSFRRKQDAHEVPNSLEFGLRNGLQFPGGLNAGKRSLSYSTNLPCHIPNSRASTIFPSRSPVWRRILFAVNPTYSEAALWPWPSFNDVSSGHLHTGQGRVSHLRRWWVAKQHPIDVAKEMGADLVIGIHLETQPISPTEPLSSFAILGQSILS